MSGEPLPTQCGLSGGVKPCAWAHRYSPRGLLHTLRDCQQDAEDDAAIVGGSAHAVALYDQPALDAALALWPRDCRLCAHFTTKTGGCVSVVQCVDSDQYKATAPRQYWVSGPSV